MGRGPPGRPSIAAGPTPTATTTFRCSARSDSRSPSTPIPAWPPSPSLRRWPVQFLDVPPGVPKLLGVEPQTGHLAVHAPELLPYVRFDVSGTDHLPHDGPALLCANHRRYFDPLAVGYAAARHGRPIRFLGKKEVFDAPVVGDLARAMGGIRVERGTGSDEPLREAADGLGAGEMVAIMPQGTIPRGRAFFDPDLKGGGGRPGSPRDGRRGAPRAGHPDGLWGTEQVWPAQPGPQRVERRRPADGAGPRRRPGASWASSIPTADTDGHHGGHRRPAAARGPGAPRAHARGAGQTLPRRDDVAHELAGSGRGVSDALAGG